MSAGVAFAHQLYGLSSVLPYSPRGICMMSLLTSPVLHRSTADYDEDKGLVESEYCGAGRGMCCPRGASRNEDCECVPFKHKGHAGRDL